jgi:hypothetical protein
VVSAKDPYGSILGFINDVNGILKYLLEMSLQDSRIIGRNSHVILRDNCTFFLQSSGKGMSHEKTVGRSESFVL